MDEIWRVLKPDGELLIAMPYPNSPGYLRDPTHCNERNEAVWSYFDPLDPKTGGHNYKFYRPKPWQIMYDKLSWHEGGTLEIVLRKRILNKKYEAS